MHHAAQQLVRTNWLRSSHTAAITKTIKITTKRVRVLLVELLHAEYALAYSTNCGHAFFNVLVNVLVNVVVFVLVIEACVTGTLFYKLILVTIHYSNTPAFSTPSFPHHSIISMIIIIIFLQVLK